MTVKHNAILLGAQIQTTTFLHYIKKVQMLMYSCGLGKGLAIFREEASIPRHE